VDDQNLLTDQLTVSQVADWSTRALVNLPKCLTKQLEQIVALNVTFLSSMSAS